MRYQLRIVRLVMYMYKMYHTTKSTDCHEKSTILLRILICTEYDYIIHFDAWVGCEVGSIFGAGGWGGIVCPYRLSPLLFFSFLFHITLSLIL